MALNGRHHNASVVQTHGPTIWHILTPFSGWPFLDKHRRFCRGLKPAKGGYALDLPPTNP